MAEKYRGYYRKGLLMCELHRTGSISGLLDYTNESSGSSDYGGSILLRLHTGNLLLKQFLSNPSPPLPSDRYMH
jgi:hypothetical protein